jgi:hypothetical protein
MKTPPLDPHIADVAPAGPALTEYDEEHMITYMRMLDADQQGADWRDAPRYVRGCQPEIKECYNAIMVVNNDGKMTVVKVTKDMNDKTLNREICTFNDSGDIRKCADWDDASTRRDMKDTKGNWYKVADE